MDAVMPLGGVEEARLRSERARLVGFCYRHTGNLDAAEDLAQETFYEALRHAHKLHDPSGYSAWLSAIARNVCARWNERRGREAARSAPFDAGDGTATDDEAAEPGSADDYDLDVALERHELVELLDRALALLPAESREVLIEHYVRESPHAEIAARLGLTGPAVAKRLERGRLRLKRVLATHLIHQATAFGLAGRLFDDWEETRIWCPYCGQRQLLSKRMPDGRLWLICRPCLIPVNLYATVPTCRGIHSTAAIYAHAFEAHHRRFVGGIADQRQPCPHCGTPLAYRVGLDPSDHLHYASVWCDRCGDELWQFKSTWHLLATPEGRRFQREHPRLRFLPDRLVMLSARPLSSAPRA